VGNHYKTIAITLRLELVNNHKFDQTSLYFTSFQLKYIVSNIIVVGSPDII